MRKRIVWASTAVLVVASALAPEAGGQAHDLPDAPELQGEAMEEAEAPQPLPDGIEEPVEMSSYSECEQTSYQPGHLSCINWCSGDACYYKSWNPGTGLCTCRPD